MEQPVATASATATASAAVSRLGYENLHGRQRKNKMKHLRRQGLLSRTPRASEESEEEPEEDNWMTAAAFAQDIFGITDETGVTTCLFIDPTLFEPDRFNELLNPENYDGADANAVYNNLAYLVSLLQDKTISYDSAAFEVIRNRFDQKFIDCFEQKESIYIFDGNRLKSLFPVNFDGSSGHADSRIKINVVKLYESLRNKQPDYAPEQTLLPLEQLNENLRRAEVFMKKMDEPKTKVLNKFTAKDSCYSLGQPETYCTELAACLLSDNIESIRTCIGSQFIDVNADKIISDLDNISPELAIPILRRYGAIEETGSCSVVVRPDEVIDKLRNIAGENADRLDGLFNVIHALTTSAYNTNKFGITRPAGSSLYNNENTVPQFFPVIESSGPAVGGGHKSLSAAEVRRKWGIYKIAVQSGAGMGENVRAAANNLFNTCDLPSKRLRQFIDYVAGEYERIGEKINSKDMAIFDSVLGVVVGAENAFGLMYNNLTKVCDLIDKYDEIEQAQQGLDNKDKNHELLPQSANFPHKLANFIKGIPEFVNIGTNSDRLTAGLLKQDTNKEGARYDTQINGLMERLDEEMSKIVEKIGSVTLQTENQIASSFPLPSEPKRKSRFESE